MASEKLKPCRNCGSENMHHFPKSDTVECNVCAESSRAAEWQADTAREASLRAELARKDKEIAELKSPRAGTCQHMEACGFAVLQADLAAWQAHSAGLVVMIKALEELVEAMDACLKAMDDNWSLTVQRKAYANLDVARAKVEELRGGNP